MKLRFLIILIAILLFSCGNSGDTGSQNDPDKQETDIITASMLNNEYGAAFPDNGLPIVMADNNGLKLVQGDDYEYDQPLIGGEYDIFDRKDGGSLDVKKYFKVLMNGKNIYTEYGLNPVAKDLSVLRTPEGRSFYIDPATGNIVLPRPVYWSKMESLNNLTVNPEINSDYGASIEETGSVASESTPAGEYGNCLYRGTAIVNATSAVTQTGTKILYPYGKGRGNSQGTISFWLKLNSSTPGMIANTTSALKIYITDDIYISFDSTTKTTSNAIVTTNKCSIYSGTNLISSADINMDEWTYYYIIWDYLAVTKKICIYKNQSLLLDSAANLLDLSNSSLSVSFYNYSYANKFQWAFGTIPSSAYSNLYVDNIKVWNHVVSENPTWAIPEKSLHEVYGGDNYTPGLLTVVYYLMK